MVAPCAQIIISNVIKIIIFCNSEALFYQGAKIFCRQYLKVPHSVPVRQVNIFIIFLNR